MVQRLSIMLNTEKMVCINVTWSPGLSYGAKTVHYVEYRKEGMYKCFLLTSLTFYLLVPSADNLYKQLRPRSG